MAQLDPEGIRARIREARKGAGLTQQDLADALEVHKRTVENYERFRVPDYKALNRIGAVTGKPLEWFLYGESALTENEDRLRSILREELATQRADLADDLAAAFGRLQKDLEALVRPAGKTRTGSARKR